MQFVSPCTLSPYFSHWVFFGVLTRHVLVAVFAQGGVLRNPNEGLCGQIPNIALRAIASLYIELVPLMWNREVKEAKGPTLHHVSCVLSVVLMGRETGLLQLLAPLLLTGGKGANPVIRGNVVLNNFLSLVLPFSWCLCLGSCVCPATGYGCCTVHLRFPFDVYFLTWARLRKYSLRADKGPTVAFEFFDLLIL
jgi:hypothetical protein